MTNRNLLLTSLAAVFLSFGALSVDANAADMGKGMEMKGMSSEMMSMHKSMHADMMKMSDMAKKEGMMDMADMYKNMGDMMDDMMKMQKSMEMMPLKEPK